MKKILFTLLLACAATTANATLVGTEMNFDVWFEPSRGMSDNYMRVKDPGYEYVSDPSRWSPQLPYSFDISSKAIEFVMRDHTFPPAYPWRNNPGTLVFYNFNDTSGKQLSGISRFTTKSTFPESRIRVIDNRIEFNFTGYRFYDGQRIYVELNFDGPAVTKPASTPAPTPAPTPAQNINEIKMPSIQIPSIPRISIF